MKSFSILTVLLAGLFFVQNAYAGGPWDEQYCNIVTKTTVTKDSHGNVIEESTVETMVCDDGVTDFLAYSGIAKDCKAHTMHITIKGRLVPQRYFTCRRLDGVQEIVTPGFNNN